MEAWVPRKEPLNFACWAPLELLLNCFNIIRHTCISFPRFQTCCCCCRREISLRSNLEFRPKWREEKRYWWKSEWKFSNSKTWLKKVETVVVQAKAMQKASDFQMPSSYRPGLLAKENHSCLIDKEEATSLRIPYHQLQSWKVTRDRR